VSPVDGEPQLLYLEPDDEITSVIRRLRGADAGRVILVAPGRSRATSSVVALRLLQRAAAETGRSVALVADASTRSLAGEAGIAAFASVADATSPTPSPAEPMTPTRAPIHVVRGAGGAPLQSSRPILATDGMEETVAVHLPPPAKAGSSGRGRRRTPRLPRWPWLVALLVVALAAGAALLPGATVRITPATVPVDPRTYPIIVAIAGRQTGELHATKPGTATGQRLEQVAATGTVTFINWSLVAVEVAQGTRVSVGGTTAFSTIERFVVQRGRFNGQEIQPGQGSVGAIAVVPGVDGNVAAAAIDTVDDAGVRTFLRGSPDNPNRLVTNADAMTGGLETPHSVIQQSDIDAVVTAIRVDLQDQLTAALAADPDRLYAGALDTEVPTVDVPVDLLGKEDTPTFELSGTLAYDRAYASRADVEATARSALLADTNAVPAGTAIVDNSISVDMGDPIVVGEELQVQASVTAAAATRIDEAQVRDRIAGLTVDEAKSTLKPLGEIDVDLWPAWVDRVPRLTFRIDVKQVVRAPTQSPGPSPTQTLGP
jgi:hypothetical protein